MARPRHTVLFRGHIHRDNSVLSGQAHPIPSGAAAKARSTTTTREPKGDESLKHIREATVDNTFSHVLTRSTIHRGSASLTTPQPVRNEPRQITGSNHQGLAIALPIAIILFVIFFAAVSVASARKYNLLKFGRGVLPSRISSRLLVLPSLSDGRRESVRRRAEDEERARVLRKAWSTRSMATTDGETTSGRPSASINTDPARTPRVASSVYSHELGLDYPLLSPTSSYAPSRPSALPPRLPSSPYSPAKWPVSTYGPVRISVQSGRLRPTSEMPLGWDVHPVHRTWVADGRVRYDTEFEPSRRFSYGCDRRQSGLA